MLDKLVRRVVLLMVAVSIAIIPSVFATAEPANAAAATRLLVRLRSGEDDLRGGGFANLYIKLAGNPKPFVVRNFTNGAEIPKYQIREFTVIIPGLDPKDLFDNVEAITLEHVSQESFGQTADNWNLNGIEFKMMDLRRQPTLVYAGDFHTDNYSVALLWRFDGAHRTYMVPLL